jgi:hypothetical protein
MTSHFSFSAFQRFSFFSRPRCRRDLPSLERRAGAWLRDFKAAATRSDFTILCLGSKTTQAKDIRYAESVVDALRKE